MAHKKRRQGGFSLVEILISIGVFSAIVFAAVGIFIVSQESVQIGRAKTKGVFHLKDYVEKVKNIKRHDWDLLVNGTYVFAASGNDWELQTTTTGEVLGDYTRSVIIANAYRDITGALALSGTEDPSTKLITVNVSWGGVKPGSISQSIYVTRYLDNLAWIQTTQAEFLLGTIAGTEVTNTAGGEVTIGHNTKAKWCTPDFSVSTIDLPDGPPVAVIAKSYATSSSPNDIFVATSPETTNSIKMAHIQVSQTVDPPAPVQQGIFTLDSSRYSSGTFPAGLPVDNSFKTNDVAYYQSASGNTYALIATNLPSHEVVVAKVHDGVNSTYQDPVNKIYQYWTSFNTRIYVTPTATPTSAPTITPTPTATRTPTPTPSGLQNTGFLNPSANAADSGGDGNGYQTNSTSSYTDNATFAQDSNSGSGTGTSCTGADKDKHRFYNYGISLPSSPTINGIEVRLDARVDSTTGSPIICVQLSWDGGTTWTSTKSTSTLTTNEATYTLGGSADTWGRTWTDANFTNANFRVRVIDVASNTSRDFSLDWVSVKVYYTGGIYPTATPTATPTNTPTATPTPTPATTNDQAPYGYGAKSVTVLGDRGYVASGGYLYVFDLSNIDSKGPTTELDQMGCRIELDGFDCQPGSGTDRKYSAGQSGTTWSTTTGAAHLDCSDGGNIELYANNDLYGVTVSGNNYIYVAVGAGTNPELNIVNATNIPTTSSSPTISSSSCGRISGGNASWKRVGSLDFNTSSGTEEAANSVYAKSDGSRAYISSNGGIDSDGNGQPDSKQFYVVNTSTKTAPAFLSSGTGGEATSGFYYGSTPNDELFPRRSLTVLNGDRAVLVGEDGFEANANNPQDYQVLDIETEATPLYCGGLEFDQGFNDLTAVSEADSDTFVYMIANTNLNELKIVQGGPDGTYSASGVFTTQTFDAGKITAFNRFYINAVKPSAATSVRYQVSVVDPGGSGTCSDAVFSDFTFVGPDGTAGTYFTDDAAIPIDNSGSGYENPGRCFQFRTYLDTTDYDQTPVFQDVTVNYSP